MEGIIIDRQTLPETINSYIHSEKVRLVEENGAIVLFPIYEEYSIIEESFGMFSNGKLSGEKFIEEKKLEKELEKWIFSFWMHAH